MAKFRVQGPDAAAVLSRLSANDVTREVGRLVYTQWLNPAGGIVADLTVTRLAEDDFLVVASDLIHRRIEPAIRRESTAGETVVVTDVTSAYTLLAVQGPRSRELLSRLTDADLSNAAFPYLTSQHIQVGYAPVIASRVTYVGELGWELYVPTEYAVGVYDDLMAVGSDLGVRPVGMAAMSGLRLEKGTATWASTSTTRTRPWKRVSASLSRGTSPVASSGVTRCWPHAARGRLGSGSSGCG
jgi:4-methylaminobutanoate oxidase (formaldehyde-forming)